MQHANAVLLVDDQPKLATLVVQLLARLGFAQTHVANNASDALAMLRIHPYALVISDLYMDGGDGLQLLRSMRTDPETNRVPFILAEEGFYYQDIHSAVRLGVDGILVKPYELNLFRTKISYALGDRNRRRRVEIEEYAQDAMPDLPAQFAALTAA